METENLEKILLIGIILMVITIAIAYFLFGLKGITIHFGNTNELKVGDCVSVEIMQGITTYCVLFPQREDYFICKNNYDGSAHTSFKGQIIDKKFVTKVNGSFCG